MVDTEINGNGIPWAMNSMNQWYPDPLRFWLFCGRENCPSKPLTPPFVARNVDPARTKSSPADQQVSGQGSHPHVESIGVLKDLKSDCCENTMQKLNPDVFFSGEFLGSFACLGASNSLIFVVQIPVCGFCWCHYQFSWVQFPFQTRLFDWFNTHNHVYSTSFVGFIVWSFIWICLTIWIPQFLKNGQLWEMMIHQCTGHWTFSHMSGQTKFFRCWLYVIVYIYIIMYTYIYI